MKTSNVLKKARGLVAQGWCKGASIKPNKRGGYSYCARGALIAASGDQNVSRQEALMSLSLHVPQAHSVVSFNDADDTKKRDILEAFDWAIGERLAHGD